MVHSFTITHLPALLSYFFIPSEFRFPRTSIYKFKAYILSIIIRVISYNVYSPSELTIIERVIPNTDFIRSETTVSCESPWLEPFMCNIKMFKMTSIWPPRCLIINSKTHIKCLHIVFKAT